MKLVILLLPAVFGLAYSGNSEAADEPRDPIVHVKPAERPELRAVVPAEEFGQRLAAALERIGDWREWEESRAPAIGRRIAGIFPNGQVAGVVEAGDVFFRLDGQVLWGDGVPAAETSERRLLEYYSASENRMKSMRVDAGKFGVAFARYWRPELLYLQGEHRDPAWDELVIAAVTSRGTDPDLAETALARAVAAGLPRNDWTAQVAAEIALMQNRPEVAADFASFADEALQADAGGADPILFFRIALANYHLYDALKIVQMNPALFDELHPAGIQRLIDLHTARPEAERMLPPPTVLAEAMYRDDLTPKLLGLEKYPIEQRIPRIRRGEEVTFEASTAHFVRWSLVSPEPTPHFDVTYSFAVDPDGSSLNVYLRWFALRLLHNSPWDDENSDPLYHPNHFLLAVDQMASVQFQFGNTHTRFEFGDPTMPGLNGETQTARIVRVGGQAEVLLNGHRIYYGPVPTDVPAARLEFDATGTSVRLRDLRWTELIERAD